MKKIILILLLFGPVCLLSQPGLEKTFSLQEIRQDLSFFIKTVEHVHPNPYHSIRKENFYALRDSMLAGMKDQVACGDAWLFFNRLMAAFDEGHSTIGYPSEIEQDIRDEKVKIFPVLVGDYNGKGIRVRYDLSSESLMKPGDLITAINGKSVREIMEHLKLFFGGLPSWRTVQIQRDFAALMLITGFRPPYHIEFEQAGEKKKTEVEGVSLSKLQERAAAARKQAPAQSGAVPYRFERSPENSGYILFRSMRDLPAFEKFLDSVFSDIKIKPINGLIIDLRQNGGGNSVLGERLISYISSKPYRMGGGSRWKVSDEYKSFLREQAGSNAVYASGAFQHYLELTTGEIISGNGGKPKSPGKNNLRYTGKVAVLTGPNTFSSANMLSNAIKDFGLATIIGEPTGEPCNDYGELYWTRLPHTGFLMYTCSKQFIRANGDADDPYPVFPDIEVKQDPDSRQDDVLEYARKWVSNR
ncbi:MAG: S41 family peptidase [Chitinophagaceae bacterium]